MSEANVRSASPQPWLPCGVVVLAGGFGTRVSHLLPGLPKPMAPVAGRPFVEWIVRYFAKWGCREFVLATGHLADVVESHFKTQPVPGVHVSCRAERTPLGTAGGCLNALAETPSSENAVWLVVNGDSLVFADPRPLIEAVRRPEKHKVRRVRGAHASRVPSSASSRGLFEEPATRNLPEGLGETPKPARETRALPGPANHGPVDVALLGLALDDASRFGSLEMSPDGLLKAFSEKRPGPGIINAGVYAFTEACLRSLPDRRPLSFEFDVFPPLAAEGRVRVTTVNAPFLDIGTPATLTEAERFVTSHHAHFL